MSLLRSAKKNLSSDPGINAMADGSCIAGPRPAVHPELLRGRTQREKKDKENYTTSYRKVHSVRNCGESGSGEEGRIDVTEGDDL